MALPFRQTPFPSSTQVSLPTFIEDIALSVTTFTVKTEDNSKKSYRALRGEKPVINHVVDDDDNNSGTSNSVTAAASSNGITSMTSSSISNCDSGDLFCPVGTCYTGVNGYLGCCTVSSCAARTTCIPYHAGQKSCNEDIGGCVFCSNPATPYCFRFENWETSPSAFAMWCTSSPGTTIVFYTNPVSYPSVANLPLVTFTPSWPSAASSSSSMSTTMSSKSTDRGVAALTTSTIGNDAASQPTSVDMSLNSTRDLSTGDIVGIVIGSSIALICIAALLVCLWNRRRKKNGQRQAPAEQPRGTLGGAVLPGSWLNGDGAINRNQSTSIQSQQSDNVEDLAVAGPSSARHHTGQELGDTAIAPYSIELASISARNPGTIVSSTRSQGIGIRPPYVPYSPMSILRPDSPYANGRGSYSDPGLNANHQASGPSEVYRDLDGQGWAQENQRARDYQASATRNRMELVPLTSGQIQPGTIPQSLHESPLSMQSNEIISPVSTEPSPSAPTFQQRVSSLQQDSPISIPETTVHNSGISGSSLENSGQDGIPRNHSQNQEQYRINPSTPLSSHPSNGRISSDRQQLLEATPSSEARVEASTSARSILPAADNSAVQEQSNDGRPTRGVSACGSWSGWVSAESAYADGLWENQPTGTETRQDIINKPGQDKKKQD